MVVYVVERAIDPALSFPAGLNDIDMYIPSTAGYQAETNVVRLCNHLSHPTIAVHGADEDLAGCDFHSTSALVDSPFEVTINEVKSSEFAATINNDDSVHFMAHFSNIHHGGTYIDSRQRLAYQEHATPGHVIYMGCFPKDEARLYRNCPDRANGVAAPMLGKLVLAAVPMDVHHAHLAAGGSVTATFFIGPKLTLPTHQARALRWSDYLVTGAGQLGDLVNYLLEWPCLEFNISDLGDLPQGLRPALAARLATDKLLTRIACKSGWVGAINGQATLQLHTAGAYKNDEGLVRWRKYSRLHIDALVVSFGTDDVFGKILGANDNVLLSDEDLRSLVLVVPTTAGNEARDWFGNHLDEATTVYKANMYWTSRTRTQGPKRKYQFLWSLLVDLRCPGAVVEIKRRLAGLPPQRWLVSDELRPRLQRFAGYT
ncbi:hypothetical protein COHA_004901 [Chlorella ohadii]|uniref:Uncharacterized protein n=1 Tax=Chlorella ohadii TaxID=2649997 RepID=A0AAD5DSB0_9CHLO|nr:hypothetical protein COHA_004901 [Chlorella ohadii]